MSEEARYDCLISGESEVALILGTDGDPLFIMADDANYLSAAKEIDMSEFLRQADDWLRFIGLTLAEIRDQLDLVTTAAVAFALIIDCLKKNNQSGEEDIAKEMNRDELFGETDEMLADQEVYALALNAFCAQPIIEENGWESAILFADVNSLWKLSAILDLIWMKQPEIRRVCAAWDSLPAAIFGSEEERCLFRKTAVYAGLFRMLTVDKPDMAMANPKLPQYPGCGRIIAAWRHKLVEGINED